MLKTTKSQTKPDLFQRMKERKKAKLKSITCHVCVYFSQKMPTTKN